MTRIGESERRRRRPEFVPLEDRRLLAGVATSLIGRVLTVVGTAGADTIEIRTVGDEVVVTGISVEGTVTTRTLSNHRAVRVSSVVVRGGDGDDRVVVDAAFSRPATLNGERGDDVLTGGAGNDKLIGGAGDDELHGGRGRDTLDGGSGNDWLGGGLGNDVLIGGVGRDAFFDTSGSNRMNGARADRFLRLLDPATAKTTTTPSLETPTSIPSDLIFQWLRDTYGIPAETLRSYLAVHPVEGVAKILRANETVMTPADSNTIVGREAEDADVHLVKPAVAWTETQAMDVDRALRALTDRTENNSLLRRSTKDSQFLNLGSESGAPLKFYKSSPATAQADRSQDIHLSIHRTTDSNAIFQATISEIARNWYAAPGSLLYFSVPGLVQPPEGLTTFPNDDGSVPMFTRSDFHNHSWVWDELSRKLVPRPDADFAGSRAARSVADDFAESWTAYFMDRAGLEYRADPYLAGGSTGVSAMSAGKLGYLGWFLDRCGRKPLFES